MADRIDEELALLRQRYPNAKLGPDGRSILVEDWKLRPGWNSGQTRLLVVVPPGYPTTPPDNFYTAPELRLADGREPGNASSIVDLVGLKWRQFSYHVEASDWRTHAVITQGHNLSTFFEGVERRLSELS